MAVLIIVFEQELNYWIMFSNKISLLLVVQETL